MPHNPPNIHGHESTDIKNPQLGHDESPDLRVRSRAPRSKGHMVDPSEEEAADEPGRDGARPRNVPDISDGGCE